MCMKYEKNLRYSIFVYIQADEQSYNEITNNFKHQGSDNKCQWYIKKYQKCYTIDLLGAIFSIFMHWHFCQSCQFEQSQ